MEGYFVRTLGMHRVYNSAFMNMLRDEENANYRSVIKNTLEFDPEVLKRYVNFMNNPDERTAVDQFGKGDKYFGVCTLMATLPGLADVRPRTDRGLHREVRHGVPPRLLRRASRPVAGRAPRARDLAAAASPLALRRSARTFCCTTSTPTTARSTKTSSPTPTGAATSARWWFTTIASMTPLAGFASRAATPRSSPTAAVTFARSRSAKVSACPTTATPSSPSATRSPDSSIPHRSADVAGEGNSRRTRRLQDTRISRLA